MLASPVAPQGSPASAGPIRAGDFLKVLSVNPVEKKKVGMTSLAWSIASQDAMETGASSVSAYIERVVLSQRYSAKDVEKLMEGRRKRGGKQR
jgi:hypothetical protein